MHLQYIADKFGHTTGDVPDWQIALGKEELKNIAAGSSEIMDWEASQRLFKM